MAYSEKTDSAKQSQTCFYDPVTDSWRPVSSVDPLPSSATLTEGTYATVIDSSSSSIYTYVGKAVIGSIFSSSSWQIRQIEDNNLIVRWADGNSNFDNIWDDRVVISYL